MIPWYIYAVLAAIFGTFFEITRKKALTKVHAMNFEAVRTLVIALLCLFLIPFINLDISINTLLLTYLSSLVGTIGILWMARALRHKEISVIYPLSSIKPAFVAIFAYFLLSESIGLKQIIGIAIILVSTYLLESDHHFSNFLKPLKKIIYSRYNLYFVMAILIFSATTILDKYLVSNYLDVFTYFFLSWIFIAINFNIIHLVEFGFKDTSSCFKKAHYLPLVVGFFGFLANFFGLKALSMTYASLVPPILMLSTLFIVFFGGRFFHERYLWFRVSISAIMLVGAYLVIM